MHPDAQSGQTETGNVTVKLASCNMAYVDDAAPLPNSDYSHQIDASSRAFQRLPQSRGRGMAAPIASMYEGV